MAIKKTRKKAAAVRAPSKKKVGKKKAGKKKGKKRIGGETPEQATPQQVVLRIRALMDLPGYAPVAGKHSFLCKGICRFSTILAKKFPY
ncbi:MAG TPA: hypothetical protein VER96_38810 [Polyangiaceae bacterium]|nr:hypothetical protein [Polyangiaceae bacterium]